MKMLFSLLNFTKRWLVAASIAVVVTVTVVYTIALLIYVGTR